MAHAITATQATSTLSVDFSAKIYAVYQRVTDYFAYRATVRALSNLTARELADLGLSHASVKSAAYETVYGS